MTSLWHLRHPHTDDEPPLRDDTSADAVVVGAGVVGLGVAVGLAEAGKDVVVLEASAGVGAGATGHTTGKLTVLQSPRYARLAREQGSDAARLHAEATADARDRVLEAAEDPGRATAVTWCRDEDGVEDLVAEYDALRDAGVPVRWADRDEHGLPAQMGIALDDQAQVDALALLLRLRERLLAAGGRLHGDARVTGVAMTGSPRQVRTATAVVTATHVVVATGLPILDRGLWWARTEPRRSSVVALTSQRQPSVMAISSDAPTVSTRAARLPDGKEVTLVAGGDHRTGTPATVGYDELAEFGRETYGGGAVLAQWSAQDWSSADGLPLAGPVVPGDDTVLAAAGFDKWGLTSGTTAAQVLVDRVLGRPASDVARLYDPVRLRPRAAAKDLARNGATVGWHATSGWLRALATGAAEPAEGEGVVGRDGVRPVAASRVDGVVRRCVAVCPHLGGIVAWEQQDATWGCPLHGSRFAPDGAVRSGPAVRGLEPVDEEAVTP